MSAATQVALIAELRVKIDQLQLALARHTQEVHAHLRDNGVQADHFEVSRTQPTATRANILSKKNNSEITQVSVGRSFLSRIVLT